MLNIRADIVELSVVKTFPDVEVSIESVVIGLSVILSEPPVKIPVLTVVSSIDVDWFANSVEVLNFSVI